MNPDRRSVLRAGIGLLTGSALAGCLGGGGSDSNNSSNSSNNSTSAPGATMPESAGTSLGTGTSGTTTSGAQILGNDPEFDDGELTISLDGDRTVEQVRLMGPKGEFETYQPESYESSATFTLIKQSSKQFGYIRYPYGTYRAIALSGGRPIDRQSYQFRPRFTIQEVESAGSQVALTFENVGTAPAPITAARIYSSKITPGPNQFGGGYVDQDAIVAPGDTLRVETRLMGFASQMPIQGNKSASDYDRKYCTGEIHPITVSHRVFGQIHDTTGSLSFTGDPRDGSTGKSAVCSEYTLNFDGGSSTSGTSRTAAGTTSGGLPTLTQTSGASTTEAAMSTNSTSNS